MEAVDAALQEVVRLRDGAATSRLCGSDLGPLKGNLDEAARNLAMGGSSDAYTIVNLKKSALRAVDLARKPSCEEMALRQALESSAKALDQMREVVRAADDE